MQAAFVDIGLRRDAFLDAGDIHRNFHDMNFIDDEEENQEPEEEAGAIEQGMNEHLPVDVPIEDLIEEGEDILVQISKEPLEARRARFPPISLFQVGTWSSCPRWTT